MYDYTGIKCPKCDIPFLKDDDIVVCPDCGAPFHRDCYNELGHCLFKDEHSEGKDWQPPSSPNPPNPDAEIKDKECSSCGTLNANSALFCNGCGKTLIGNPDEHKNRTNQDSYQQNTSDPFDFQSAFGGMPFPLPDLMGGVNPTDTIEDDITYGDASKLVKQATPYYMQQFYRIKNIGKSRLNKAAFLCGGPWMLYRKMYKRGIFWTIIQFGLYLALQLSTIFFSNPALLKAAELAGVDVSSGLQFLSDDMYLIFDILLENKLLYLQFVLPVICFALLFVTMIICGITANKAYMKHCLKTLKSVKSQKLPVEAESSLITEKGGINMAIAVCMLICYFIMTNLPIHFAALF